MELGEASSASGLCMQNLQRVRYGRLAALWAGEIRAFVVCVCCVHMYAPCFTYINLQDLEGYDMSFLFLPPLSSVSYLCLGHWIQDCKEKGKDRQSSHRSRARPDGAGAGAVADETTQCHRCGQKGHFQRDCPQGGKILIG